MSTPGPQKARSKDFSAIDYYQMTDYRKNRFPSYEPYIAYALISENAEGQRVAHQFEFPYLADPQVPKVKRLKEISFGNNGKKDDIHAITTDGEELTTNRSIKLESHSSDNVSANFDLYFFSPIPTENKLQASLWKTEESSNDDDCAETQPDIIDQSVVKGGDLKFNWSDISERAKTLSSLEDQNDVMGHSARDEYYNYWESSKDKLSYKMADIIWRSLKGKHIVGPFMRPEWCHALAKQFHPVNMNPQDVNNLGAAPFWINSKMMVIEDTLRWHAKKYPDAKIQLKSQFNMFGDSNVVKNGQMEATIVHAQRSVKVSQDLKPHQKVPVYSQSTDIALTSFVVDSLLKGRTPNLIPTNKDDGLVAGSNDNPGAIASIGHEQAPFSGPFNITLNDRFDIVFTNKADSASKDNPYRQTFLDNLREYQHLMINTLMRLLQEVSHGQYQNFRKWLEYNGCTYLDLSYDKARNINLYHLGQALRRTKVTTLDLSNNLINEENGRYFGQMMKGTPISTMILKDRSFPFARSMDRRRISKVNAAGASALARGLKGSEVRNVDFSGNQLGHQGAIGIVRELRDTPVTNLCISNNDINPAEMATLVSCVDGTSLENIDVGFEDPALNDALQKNKLKIQRSIEKKQDEQPGKYKSRLFVGEGDFRFTAAFLKKHENKKGLAAQVTATCFESREDIWKKYSKTTLNSFYAYQAKQRRNKNECEVVYEVDARTLHENQNLAGKRFQRIHYNFPHHGGSYDDPSLTLMIHDFFQSAKKLQRYGDRIHMALPSPSDTRARHFIEGYAYTLLPITASAGYKLIKKRKFDSQRYPGYQPTPTDDPSIALQAVEACEYVFERTSLTYAEIFKVNPPQYVPLDEANPRGRELICLPQMDIDEDSSDYEDDAATDERELPPELEPISYISGTPMYLRGLHSHQLTREIYKDYDPHDPEYIRLNYSGSYDGNSDSSDPDQVWSPRKSKKSHHSAKKAKYEEDNPEFYSGGFEENSDLSEAERERSSTQKASSQIYGINDDDIISKNRSFITRQYSTEKNKLERIKNKKRMENPDVEVKAYAGSKKPRLKKSHN